MVRSRSKKPRRPLKPSGRNPYVVATKRLGHAVKSSAKRYSRKGRRGANDMDLP